MRTPPTCRKRRSPAPPKRCAPSKAATAAPTPSAPGRTNRKLYGDDNPLGAPAFDAKVKLLEADRRLCARQGPARAAGDGLASPRPGRWSKSCAPTARPIATSARWCGSMSRWWPAKATGRRPAVTASAAARAMSASSTTACLAGRGRRGGAPGAGQSRRGAGAGRRNGRRARRRLAGRDAARGGRPRPGRRFQSQEDLRLRRPDGPAGRRQGRHRGRRRHHAGSAAARCRSTTRARRPTAPC